MQPSHKHWALVSLNSDSKFKFTPLILNDNSISNVQPFKINNLKSFRTNPLEKFIRIVDGFPLELQSLIFKVVVFDHSDILEILKLGVESPETFGFQLKLAFYDGFYFEPYTPRDPVGWHVSNKCKVMVTGLPYYYIENDFYNLMVEYLHLLEIRLNSIVITDAAKYFKFCDDGYLQLPFDEAILDDCSVIKSVDLAWISSEQFTFFSNTSWFKRLSTNSTKIQELHLNFKIISEATSRLKNIVKLDRLLVMNSMPVKLYKFSPDSPFIKLLPKTRFLQIETFGKVKRNVADLCLLAGYDLKRFKKTKMAHYMEDDSGVRLPKTYQSTIDTLRLTIKRAFDFIHIVRLQNFDNLKYLIVKFKPTAKVISGFTDALLLDTVEYLEIKDYQDVHNQYGKPYLIYKAFPNLTSLKLTNCVVTPMWLNSLPPQLQKLTIDCCQVSNCYPNDKMIFKTSHMHSLKKFKKKLLSKQEDSKPLAKYYLKVLLPISLKGIEVSSNSGSGLQRLQYPYSQSQVFDSVYDLNFELFKSSKRSQFHIDSFRLR